MIDNILIEVISIVKRFFNKEIQKTHPEFFNKLLNVNIIDHLIFLLNKENIIIQKLLHMLLLMLIDM
jgi:hypothetical protein